MTPSPDERTGVENRGTSFALLWLSQGKVLDVNGETSCCLQVYFAHSG